jgi:hypothetical protein
MLRGFLADRVCLETQVAVDVWTALNGVTCNCVVNDTTDCTLMRWLERVRRF